MILCGNIYVDELKNTFFLCCVLCKKKSRRYTEFTSHIKAKHKDISEKEATPPSSQRQFAKKIKHEDSSDEEDDDDEDYGNERDRLEDTKPEVEIKDEMDVDALEQFTDDIKYDVQEIEPFIDPILAMEEKDNTNAPDMLDVADEDVKDEDYAFEEGDNDDSDDEDYRDDDDNDNDDGDSESDVNELPATTDKFTPTFYRKKRYVNDFIELYKSQPVLWDLNNPQFEDPKAQKDAEQAIINGMQKFNIFLKPTALKAAINRVHKYCEIIKSDMDNGDAKKITAIAKGYYEKCDFLKDLLAKKATPETEKQNCPLTFKQWDDNTSKFIETYSKFSVLYDTKNPLFHTIDEKNKALAELNETLITKHNIHFSKEDQTNAIEQFHAWYYDAKRRKGKRKIDENSCEDKYLQMCKFMPNKQLKMRQRLTCHLCGTLFYTEHNLKLHLFKAHQIGDLPFQCEQCGLKFDSKLYLRVHTLRVHVGKQFACEYCGRKFAIKPELNTHIKIHTAEKPHVCELCGKSFRLKTQLGYHVTAIHTKIRAFKCTMCPKDFLKKRDLTDHIKSHLNIRDKICETCGKGFSNCHSLIRHRQIHSAVKKYECKLCDAKFHQFVGLNGHMKRTHNIVKKDSQ